MEKLAFEVKGQLKCKLFSFFNGNTNLVVVVQNPVDFLSVFKKTCLENNKSKTKIKCLTVKC